MLQFFWLKVGMEGSTKGFAEGCEALPQNFLGGDVKFSRKVLRKVFADGFAEGLFEQYLRRVTRMVHKQKVSARFPEGF